MFQYHVNTLYLLHLVPTLKPHYMSVPPKFWYTTKLLHNATTQTTNYVTQVHLPRLWTDTSLYSPVSWTNTSATTNISLSRKEDTIHIAVWHLPTVQFCTRSNIILQLEYESVDLMINRSKKKKALICNNIFYFPDCMTMDLQNTIVLSCYNVTFGFSIKVIFFKKQLDFGVQDNLHHRVPQSSRSRVLHPWQVQIVYHFNGQG